MKYLLTSADIYYGLSPKEVRRLAYEFAVELKVEHIPESWSKNKQAGPHWFTAFIKRHQELSIRKPQHTSLARATAFNRTTVAEFFKKLFILLPTPKISNFLCGSISCFSHPDLFVNYQKFQPFRMGTVFLSFQYSLLVLNGLFRIR